MLGFASNAAISDSPVPLRARSSAHSDQPNQHDFSHEAEPWDRPAVLALAHELGSALGLHLSEAALAGVRTRDELVELVLNDIAERAQVESDDNDKDDDDGSTLRVRITAKRAPEGWYVERSLPWTPYALETIWEDAVHAGTGSVVDVTTPHGTPRSSVVRLEQRFAPLRYRGVRVRVRVASPEGI